MTAERDLVEPEAVNASSGAGDGGGSGDPVPGGRPERAGEQAQPEPADCVLGAPPEPAESETYGSETAGAG